MYYISNGPTILILLPIADSAALCRKMLTDNRNRPFRDALSIFLRGWEAACAYSVVEGGPADAEGVGHLAGAGKTFSGEGQVFLCGR